MITNKTRRMINRDTTILHILLLLLLIVVLAADTIPILSATAAALETDADAAVSDSSAGSSTINTTIVTMTTEMGNPYEFNSNTNSFLVNSRRLLNQNQKTNVDIHGTNDNNTTKKPPPENDWFFPLLLSCLAGASTCAGAAVVFCVPASTIRHAMAGSLSFAASVMITVSIVSILPEVLTGLVESRTTTETETTTYPIVHTDLLIERGIAFGVGVLAYVLLAKLLQCLPDPDTLYLLDEAAMVAGQEEDDCKRQYDLYLSEEEEEEDPGTATIRTTRQRRGAGILPSSSSSSHSTEDADVDGDEDLTAFSKARRQRSWRVTLMLFASLLLHNFPEGLCVVRTTSRAPGVVPCSTVHRERTT